MLTDIIIEERLTSLPTVKRIHTHTSWIAKQSQTPIVNTGFGPFINKYCHMLDKNNNFQKTFYILNYYKMQIFVIWKHIVNYIIVLF